MSNKYSYKNAQREAKLMEEEIKSGKASDYVEAEKNIEEDVKGKVERTFNFITEKWRELGDNLTIDSHAFYHVFDKSNLINETIWDMDMPQFFEKAEILLGRHINDRINKWSFWCDSSILGWIIYHNMKHLVDLEEFYFKPKDLTKKEYIDLFEKNINMFNSTEFSDLNEKNMILCFLNAKSPREFFQSLFELDIKFPVKDELLLIKIFEDLKENSNKEKVDNYISKYYSSNGSNISIDELTQNLKNSKNAKILERGLFVDVDGTLIIDGKLNQELATAIENVENVVIFTGGIPEQKTEELRKLGLSEKLLPVVSKSLYKWKILEKLIDDSTPDYQGFQTVMYFKPAENSGYEIYGIKWMRMPYPIDKALKFNLNEDFWDDNLKKISYKKLVFDVFNKTGINIIEMGELLKSWNEK